MRGARAGPAARPPPSPDHARHSGKHALARRADVRGARPVKAALRADRLRTASAANATAGSLVWLAAKDSVPLALRKLALDVALLVDALVATTQVTAVMP